MNRPVKTQMPATPIPSKDGSPGIKTVKNLGNLGAKVTPLKPSNNPGPMTAPSAQGPTRPKR